MKVESPNPHPIRRESSERQSKVIGYAPEHSGILFRGRMREKGGRLKERKKGGLDRLETTVGVNLGKSQKKSTIKRKVRRAESQNLEETEILDRQSGQWS